MVESERTTMSERIMKESLSEDFYKEIGGISGRKRDDLRFYLKPTAVEIRNLVGEIFRERDGKISITGLAREIGVSEGTFSLAIGGRAGEKVNKKLGMSSTDFIISKLGQLTQNNNLG